MLQANIIKSLTAKIGTVIFIRMGTKIIENWEKNERKKACFERGRKTRKKWGNRDD